MAAKAGFAIVTPASKGLGFAFARHLLANTPLPVVATARTDCDAVKGRLLDRWDRSGSGDRDRDLEKRLTVLQVDVTDESTIKNMTSTIRDTLPDTPLRLALTVPGILNVEKSPAQIDAAAALDSFRVNSLGPMLLMKHLSAFLPAKSAAAFPEQEARDGQLGLPGHAIYAMMAARVGSISDNGFGGWYSYRASKAAVFQLAKTFDLFLRTRSKERALAVAMHPGTVQTDFTRDYQDGREMLTPDESAAKLLRVICGMGPGVNEGRGRCWDWKGEEVLP
ncbi:NAD(P)-binding protein [Aspergillus steynii IBT 23096]|uniref:NAD(P)-binding protein n=1 Tax=Aspergillus steynii IBT 23096 TaxID=1392250 RepID=A0A2I2GH63_9EURO|nr:NAD(P)-binding protein [Aspergillus steynii IBT 23096]PLB52214.1 NAD(P)-binding protein [Aspergillus steynii IBT 23096]